ncbi:hypothetical protein ABT112_13410 [Streptomyces sp. NPDC002055]|uniref:hypothetical protein n=1 Tax=Streptomyces sp. NPDC002055 TaxID=3154534 RepID=UPI00332F417F
MSQATGGGARLLPWVSPEGKPCYLFGDGAGCVSRAADNVERVQLGMAADLLDHVTDMLSDGYVTPEQLRFVAARMSEALRDVHRIAQSRGERLARPAPVERAGREERGVSPEC